MIYAKVARPFSYLEVPPGLWILEEHLEGSLKVMHVLSGG